MRRSVVIPHVRRRAFAVVLLAVPVTIFIAGASIAVYNRANFGTFFTTGVPPRIEYCDRNYYPGNPDRIDTLANVTSFLTANGMSGLTRIGSTPSGLPIVASVMSAETKVSLSTNVCAMEIWVQTGADAYVGYGISGGP